MTTKPRHVLTTTLLLGLLSGCTQPAPQPAPSTTPTEPYEVSDRDDPFEIKKLIDQDDPSRISDPVIVGDKTYSLEEYAELARPSILDNTTKRDLFEISIKTNIYSRVGDSQYVRDMNFKREDLKNVPILVNLDILPKGHFYKCPGPFIHTDRSYRKDNMLFMCARAGGELWIGFERDESMSGNYKVPPEINEFIDKAIKNTKIWNECHQPSEESVAPRSIYRSLEEQKCMEDKGIHKTYLHVFYKASKITTYRIFIMEPFNPNPQPGEKHGWRVIGHLPYELDYDPN
jgi:hypothetical protein